jgi:hypothetical protein
MIRTAPEGRGFIIGAFAIAVGLALATWWIALLIWLPITVWVVAFFRDSRAQGRAGAAADHRARRREGGERDRDR